MHRGVNRLLHLSHRLLAAALMIGLVAAPTAVAHGSAPTGPAAADDNAPGVPLPPSPVMLLLDPASDTNDVFALPLTVGDVLVVTLGLGAIHTPGFAPDLYLFAPGTVDVMTEAPIQGREGLVLPKTLLYEVTTSGTYLVDISSGLSSLGSGEAVLTWKVLRPVYRFYNFTNGTHFFTDSVPERDMVIARWPNVYRFEGIAYYTNPAANFQPLYRFYNRRSGSHFYTSSPTERDMVIARWPGVFTYEGQTYCVTPSAEPGKTPVFRFYNLRNGSHFYTASSTERDMVIATWPTVYRYEGPAFYLGQ